MFTEKHSLLKLYKTDKKAYSLAVGSFGERLAADFLRKTGYKVLARNFSCKIGEIDIVAEKDDTTVFVEVKTRKNSDYGLACEFVNYKKQQKIINTSIYYKRKYGTKENLRYDIIEVYTSAPEFNNKINHIENAFSGRYI